MKWSGWSELSGLAQHTYSVSYALMLSACLTSVMFLGQVLPVAVLISI